MKHRDFHGPFLPLPTPLVRAERLWPYPVFGAIKRENRHADKLNSAAGAAKI
jgi:hypothetical protein